MDVNTYLLQNGLLTLPVEQSGFANKTLFEAVNQTPSINYYLEKDQELEKVLNIFIRVNSGRTKLSYSDLLLSIATAQWKNKDARKEITEFVDEINQIGDGFHFNKDFILKSCLILCDFNDIPFKVDNFNANAMQKIEGEWDSIKEAIRLAVQLIASFGYSENNLTSNNAVIPIAATVEKEPITIPNDDLELKLKEFRKKAADASGRKAFHIFTNKTLDELLEKRPTSLENLRKISGIGDKKVEEFGVELVGLIKKNN